MLLHDLFGLFVAEDHEGGGVGVGGGAVGGDDRDTQQVGALGLTGARVEDVGVAHAALLEVVAVVAARGHGPMVGQGNCFEALTRPVGCLGRHLDAHLPGLAVFGAAGRHLAANFDETVRVAVFHQPVGHPINRIALRHGIEVQLHARILAKDAVALQVNKMETDEFANRCESVLAHGMARCSRTRRR